MKNTVILFLCLNAFLFGCKEMDTSPPAEEEKTVYVQIATGGNTTCGIKSNGVLKCWGLNNSGAVGNGTVLNQLSPVEIDQGVNYKAVDVGNNGGPAHACAITVDGILKCWGSNLYGQLGDETTTDRYLPVVIDAGTQYQSVSVGGNGSSAHSCAITISGLVKCWGSNTYGELGDSGVGTSYQSLPVVADTAVFYKVVSVGNEHTCGVTTLDTLKCWGRNSNYRQLGTSSAADQNTPKAVDSGVSYKSVVASYSQTCAITNSGILKCWGTGFLGNAVYSGPQVSPVVIDSGVSYLTVSVGSATICGITDGHILKCWGFNGAGDVGNGTLNSQSTPAVIDSGVNYQQISAGGSQACGITSDSVLKCWGNNSAGQLGTGDTSNSLLPVAVLPQLK